MTKDFAALTALTFVAGTAVYIGTLVPAPFAGTLVPAAYALQPNHGPGSLALNTYGPVMSPVPLTDAANPRDVPGVTGRAIVPGNQSTIAGDTKATRMQQTGAFGPD